MKLQDTSEPFLQNVKSLAYKVSLCNANMHQREVILREVSLSDKIERDTSQDYRWIGASCSLGTARWHASA